MYLLFGHRWEKIENKIGLCEPLVASYSGIHSALCIEVLNGMVSWVELRAHYSMNTCYFAEWAMVQCAFVCLCHLTAHC